eukprot:c44857_g1_i1 orf=252-470(+)
MVYREVDAIRISIVAIQVTVLQTTFGGKRSQAGRCVYCSSENGASINMANWCFWSFKIVENLGSLIRCINYI